MFREVLGRHIGRMRGVKSPGKFRIDHFNHFDQNEVVTRKISATQAKLRFGEILADVSFGKNHALIEKQGKPMAALIPNEAYEEYLHYKAKKEKLTRKDILDRINRWRDSLPPLPPDTPDAVQILREIRDENRFK